MRHTAPTDEGGLMRRIYLGLIIVCLLSSPQYGSAQSSALTPTSINGPTLSATPQEEGAYSLDSRMGAAVYHFQFKLPPGRGVAPTLALNYSSAGRLRGEIADGWSLGDLPSIRRDVTREHGTAARQFTAYLEGVQELLPVSGDVTAFGGTAYRARIDRAFTRFELVNAVDSSFWIVSTPDGHQKRFDLFMPGDWRMTRSIDQWGNEADYTYSPVGIGGKTVDFVIAEIDYSLNRPGQTNQALPPLIAAHARVRFEYDQNPPNCTYAGDPGLRLPIGARLDYLTGSLRITGVWRLTGIVTEVLDTTASEWRAVRHWTLDIGISDQGCNARTSPRRQLLAISEVGFATTAGTTISTPAPTVRFRYGPLPYSTPVQTLASDIPMFASKGCTDPIRGAIVGPNDFEGSVGTMLVDLDGDGLLDLLASGSSTVNCTATWRRNLGGAFDPITHQLALPSGNGNSGRSCGLTNALGIEEFDPTPSCTGVHEKTALYYHWADVDGDGFTDLLVGGSTVDDRIFQPAPAAAAPPCIKPSCGLPGVSCNTETQCADAYAVPDGTRIPSVALTCEQMRNPYFRNPPPPSKPAKRCLGGYVWLVFKNQGGVIANQPESWCSPVALQSNPPAWNQVAAPSAASLFQLIDMNGDGIADIVSASFSEAVPYNDDYRSGRYCPKKTPDDPEARNQRLVFNVFLGDGRGNFGTPQLWTAPSWPLQCFDEEPVWTLLLDLNGDGLPDLIHETEGPTGQVIHAAYNTGHGFTLDDVTLLSNVSLFPARSRVDLFGRAEPNFSACNATFDAFVKDIDGDGIPDVACPANASCPALAPNQEVGPLNSFGYGAGFNIGVRDDVLEVHTQTEDGCRGNSVWVGRTAQVWRNFYQYRDQLTPGCGEVVGKGIRQDYLDITGNGVSERVLANTPALVSPGEIDLWSPPDDTAPGLLVEIDNGIGGRVRFRYARSRDASIVHVNSARPSYARSWTDWIVPSLPFGLWVVKEIDVFDGRREQPSATGYLYEDPVFAPEEMTFTPAGRVAASFNATFRGFQAVTTRLPRNDGDLEQAISFERYNYRQDPAGLPDYRTMKVIHQSLTFLRESQALPGASIVKETVDQTVYTTELFLNVIRFVHPLESWHIECVPSVDDGACDAQAAFRTTMTFDYRAFGVAPFFPPPRRPGDLFPDYGTPNHPAPILFALEGVRADSTTAENGALQRQSWTNHLAVLNTGIYLLLPIRRLTIERKLDGNVPQTWEQHFYDGSATSTICGSAFGACKGAITKLREFRTLGGAGTSPESSELVCDPATCLDFGFWYDGTTGNLTRIARPSEMRNLGGSAQNSSLSLTYDDTGLFHTDTFDGAGHWIQEKFDIGTGALLSTAGPELTPCNVATCLPGPRVTRIFTYDGLGRLLAESAGHDTTGTLPSAYELRVMRTRSYSDYRPEQRFNEVIERRALDWTGSTGNWTAERLLTDGLGRPFFVEISPDGVSFTSGSLARPRRSGLRGAGSRVRWPPWANERSTHRGPSPGPT